MWLCCGEQFRLTRICFSLASGLGCAGLWGHAAWQQRTQTPHRNIYCRTAWSQIRNIYVIIILARLKSNSICQVSFFRSIVFRCSCSSDWLMNLYLCMTLEGIISLFFTYVGFNKRWVEQKNILLQYGQKRILCLLQPVAPLVNMKTCISCYLVNECTILLFSFRSVKVQATKNYKSQCFGTDV